MTKSDPVHEDIRRRTEMKAESIMTNQWCNAVIKAIEEATLDPDGMAGVKRVFPRQLIYLPLFISHGYNSL